MFLVSWMVPILMSDWRQDLSRQKPVIQTSPSPIMAPWELTKRVSYFCFQDGVFDVVGDDAVVVLDEGFFVFDGEGLFAGVDLDGVVDEIGDGGGVVAGDGLLELGEDAADLDVVADGEVDGFVESGGVHGWFCCGRW